MIRARRELAARLAALEGKLPPPPHDLSRLNPVQLQRYRRWEKRVAAWLEAHPNPAERYALKLKDNGGSLGLPFDLAEILEPAISDNYVVLASDTMQMAAEKYRKAIERK